jgi:hypothetical protein
MVGLKAVIVVGRFPVLSVNPRRMMRRRDDWRDLKAGSSTEQQLDDRIYVSDDIRKESLYL